MTWVIYDTQTIRVLKTSESHAGAKRSMTAFEKKGRSVACVDRETYDNKINVMTTTYNMMDPERKPIPIRLADKGGCCDPATETYHCM